MNGSPHLIQANTPSDRPSCPFGAYGGPKALVAALARGDRRALAKAITLVESSNAAHRDAACQVLDAAMATKPESIRLGITGIPGVGKSSFIESFGLHVIEQGRRVAVLAVDPSSPRSGGSILGDKIRMEMLGRNPGAFIRPSPSGGNLGGVARRTREAAHLCEAAGFDVVIVETVGVGQSETAVSEMVDMFLLLLAPGGGDELQGIKKGIVELADLIVVNKADGDLADAAERARQDYANALRLLKPPSRAWTPRVLKCSAREFNGIADVWRAVLKYREALEPDGRIAAKRETQNRAWMWHEISQGMLDRLKRDDRVATRVNALESAVAKGETTPSRAAEEILTLFLEG